MFNLDFPIARQISFQYPATPVAEGIIDLHHNIFCFLIFILIFVLIMFFFILQRFNYYWEYPNENRQGQVNPFRIKFNMDISHGTLLEIIWTLIPSFILMLIAIPSFALLYSSDEVIDPIITIKVIGHQWYWSYEYSDYVYKGIDINFDSYMLAETDLMKGDLRLLQVDNPLIIPVRTHVRLIVTATDVLHSWAVPSLGVKIDAVPGRLNQISLYIKRTGTFFGQCSELCGVNHAFMPIMVKASTFNDYIDFIMTNK